MYGVQIEQDNIQKMYWVLLLYYVLMTPIEGESINALFFKQIKEFIHTLYSDIVLPAMTPRYTKRLGSFSAVTNMDTKYVLTAEIFRMKVIDTKRAKKVLWSLSVAEYRK